MTVMKIISGGQTGADRAGLDAAMELNIPVGGWCPKGRKAEDGAVDEKYSLQETASADYRVSAEWNVRDTGVTIIFTIGKPAGVTALTVKKAKALDKPHMVIDLDDDHDFDAVRSWLLDNDVDVLNVAGPRGSEFPDVYDRVKGYLKILLSGF